MPAYLDLGFTLDSCEKLDNGLHLGAAANLGAGDGGQIYAYVNGGIDDGLNAYLGAEAEMMAEVKIMAMDAGLRTDTWRSSNKKNK